MDPTPKNSLGPSPMTGYEYENGGNRPPDCFSIFNLKEDLSECLK